MTGTRSITLALGGGGVKCIAHAGVLRTLEKNRIAIAGIAATSAGALIAAMAGAGFSSEKMLDTFSSLDIRSLSKNRSPDRKSLFGLSRWKPVFERLFGDLTFEQLRFPVAFPIVNLEKNREETLSNGPLVEALMAAVAIPGIFPPQCYRGQTMIDGGVLNPVPAALARSLAPAHPNLAVLLAPPPEKWSEHPFPRLLKSVSWLSLLGRLRFTQALGVYVQATDLTNRLLAETRLSQEQPDLVIRPEVNHLGLFDRIDPHAIAAIGERAADQVLEAYYA